MVNENIKTKDALEEFYQDKRTENTAESTLKTYDMHIRNFIDSNDMWDFTTSLINKDHYQWWVEDLQEDDRKSDTTVATYCRSVRAFIYWLQENEYTDVFPVKIPKYQKKVKRCYTDEELKTLLEKPNRNCSEVQYQTWVYINLLISTGLRLSSSLDILVKDIDFKNNVVYVDTTKNNQGLALNLNDDVIKILKKYIQLFRLSADDYLFCKGDNTRMANHTMQCNVASYNRSHGVEKTSIHLFRHTFAKNFYIQTKDVYTLCQVLGHSNISVTEGYLKDLGVSLFADTVYNPQQQFTKKDNAPKRRGKLR
ncbi:MAG: tyrosine-type recombinase/integrase [Eubacterium sp.]|jgi:Site-specific recombinase XerD|nr:tyrosine-type recombinase/integrase [Eubacterium sp.]